MTFQIQNEYAALFLYETVSLHLAEAISYLVLGNLYLVSDMKNIAAVLPKLRPINFLAGLAVCIPYGCLLLHVPAEFRIAIFAVNGLTVICMGLGRIIFTLLEMRKAGTAS